MNRVTEASVFVVGGVAAGACAAWLVGRIYEPSGQAAALWVQYGAVSGCIGAAVAAVLFVRSVRHRRQSWAFGAGALAVLLAHVVWGTLAALSPTLRGDETTAFAVLVFPLISILYGVWVTLPVGLLTSVVMWRSCVGLSN